MANFQKDCGLRIAEIVVRIGIANSELRIANLEIRHGGGDFFTIRFSQFAIRNPKFAILGLRNYDPFAIRYSHF